MLSQINKYHNVHFGHEPKAKCDTFGQDSVSTSVLRSRVLRKRTRS